MLFYFDEGELDFLEYIRELLFLEGGLVFLGIKSIDNERNAVHSLNRMPETVLAFEFWHWYPLNL